MRSSILSVLALACAAAGATAMVAMTASAHPRQRGSLRLDGSPSTPAVDLKTHTLYVPIQCRHACSGPGHSQHVLDLVNTQRCNADVVTGCHVIARAEAGPGPLFAVPDHRTDTIYVADATGEVTVVDGARCNASVRTRCHRPLATIKTPGGFDTSEVLNPRTHTLYVVSPRSLFVIDVANCNAVTTRGCHHRIRTIRDRLGASGIDLDLATDTVYVSNTGPNDDGNTIWVLNGATCNGSLGRGCAGTPRSLTVGTNPVALTVDQRTGTVYSDNAGDGTVSVIDGGRCNAKVASGCHRRPRAVPTGLGDGQLTVDQSRRTAFVMNSEEDTLSEFSTTTCNGHRMSRCPTVRARNEQATFNPPVGGNPNGFALVPSTGTAYLVNAGGESYLAAISVRRCNALHTAGCRREPPSVPRPVVFPEVDPVTNTIYAANDDSPGIEVLNGAKCRSGHLTGCAPVATIPFPHPQANIGAIDRATDTIYAADTYANTVYAINIKHCNATDTSRCSAKASKMTVGPGPSVPVLDPTTHTLFVPDGRKTAHGLAFDQIAVLNAATCNANVTSGCGQSTGTITVGENMFQIAVSPSNDTVYAQAFGATGNGRRVWVVSEARCNATDHSGCGSAVVAKAKTGPGAAYVAVDETTHTLYVSNNANGDLPGTVSVINAASCNGSVTAGCRGPFPVAHVGHSPIGVAVDARTNRVYVGDFGDAAVSIIDGSRCDAANTSGCAKLAPERAVGPGSTFVAVNPRTNTVYVPTHLVAARLAIFGGAP